MKQGQRADDGLSLADIAGRIRLNTEQVARLCGISRRQLSYWVHRRIIPVEDSYPVDAIEKILLIKQELDRGRSLKQAVKAVEGFLAGRRARDVALRGASHAELGAIFARHLGELARQVEELSRAVAAANDSPVLRALASRLGRLQPERRLAQLATSVALHTQVRELEQLVPQIASLTGELMREPAGAASVVAPTTYRLDEGEILSRLTLNATEAARVCGVTVRQLTYWTDKGIIPAIAGESRSYSLESLRRVLLIRQAMAAGQTLGKGAAAVETSLAREARAQKEAASRPMAELRRDLERYLSDLSQQVAALRSRLTLNLALSRLRTALANLEQSGVEARLRESSETSPQLVEFTRRVDLAADQLERALTEVEDGAKVASVEEFPSHRGG